MELEKYQNEILSKSQKKAINFGFFSLTNEDHENIGSTSPKKLMENSGKAQYEVMTDEEITEYLDNALDCMNNPDLIKCGYARVQKEFFIKSLSFLKSVGRLPQKFENFDVNSLPSLQEIDSGVIR